VKAGVAESFANRGVWPANIGRSPSASGSGDGDHGQVRERSRRGERHDHDHVRRAGQLDGARPPARTLDAAPGTQREQRRVWVCGNAVRPGRRSTTSGDDGTTSVLDKYLPSTCRA
jgi:hypothetical protein